MEKKNEILNEKKNKKIEMNEKHEYGQYFTTNIILKEKVYEFILNKPEEILEPSIGQGDLVEYIINRNSKINFDMYEIDNKIKLLKNVEKIKKKIIYEDFLKQNIKKKYKTIIGNPPYVRTKKGNLFIDFIEKCYNLLEDDGELIFIIPSDFFKLTCASKLLELMLLNGCFTHIYHPNNDKMFENACIDVLIFRYCKNKSLEKKVLYNGQSLNIINSNGLITFTNNNNINNIKFDDYFEIYVGLVTGKEDIYKNDKLGNINVINGEKQIEKYIFIENYPCDNNEINEYLLKNKKELLERKIKKFNEKNWFEWGAPRNIKTIRNNMNEDCIYLYNLTRKKNVAFLDKINYFGGNLLMLKPKKKCNLNNVLNYLNSDLFKKNFIFSGRFKIGHRQIYNSLIPDNIL